MKRRQSSCKEFDIHFRQMYTCAYTHTQNQVTLWCCCACIKKFTFFFLPTFMGAVLSRITCWRASFYTSSLILPFFLDLCSWHFCDIYWNSWEWCVESLVSNHWPRFWDRYCFMRICERSAHQWGFGGGHLECEYEISMHVKIMSQLKYFDFTSQVSFRLELTTPACPIKDMVNDTTTVVWSSTDIF